ncbi:nucleoid-associated protein [Eionea flava]
MALSHIIAHRITRDNPDQLSSMDIRDTPWDNNGYTDECFRELKLTMIKRLGKEYGQFSTDMAAHPLSSWLQEYHRSTIPIERFTEKAMQHFKTLLDDTVIPLEGFLVFAHEKLATTEHLHIFFVQHATGQYINGELTIDTSRYLDIQGLRLAATINISDWQSDDIHRSETSLTLLRWRGEKDISDLFVQFIGFAEKIDIGAETDTFLATVSNYTDTLPDDIAHQTNKQVVEYCLEQNKMGKPVVIDELSTQLKENPPQHIEKVGATESSNTSHTDISLPEFSQFVSSQQPSAKPELIPDANKLRQFVRLSGRNHQLSMSFASSCLGDSIVYDPSTDSLTIKDIPARLKARLVKLSQEEH